MMDWQLKNSRAMSIESTKMNDLDGLSRMHHKVIDIRVINNEDNQPKFIISPIVQVETFDSSEQSPTEQILSTTFNTEKCEPGNDLSTVPNVWYINGNPIEMDLSCNQNIVHFTFPDHVISATPKNTDDNQAIAELLLNGEKSATLKSHNGISHITMDISTKNFTHIWDTPTANLNQ